MQTKTFDRLTGEVEVDETFVGGKTKFMHPAKRQRTMSGGGGMHGRKTAVMGVLNRGGELRTMIVPDTTSPTLQAKVREHVEPGSAVYSDAWRSYLGLGRDYDHKTVDHAEKYVDGRVHTNGL